jgi:hypothetical protein
MALAMIGVAASSDPARSAGLGVLVPVPHGDHVETKHSLSGAAIPVLQQASDDSIRRVLTKESKRGTVAFMSKLDELAARGQTLHASLAKQGRGHAAHRRGAS